MKNLVYIVFAYTDYESINIVDIYQSEENANKRVKKLQKLKEKYEIACQKDLDKVDLTYDIDYHKFGEYVNCDSYTVGKYKVLK